METVANKKKKILIVDDNMCCREIVKAICVKAGYEVYEAKNGDECLKQAENYNPDAILMDIMMPVTDGWSVCKSLRAKGNKTPIIMLTAKAQAADELMSWEAGATEYLSKPFEHAELVERLSKCMAASQAEITVK